MNKILANILALIAMLFSALLIRAGGIKLFAIWVVVVVICAAVILVWRKKNKVKEKEKENIKKQVLGYVKASLIKKYREAGNDTNKGFIKDTVEPLMEEQKAGDKVAAAIKEAIKDNQGSGKSLPQIFPRRSPEEEVASMEKIGKQVAEKVFEKDEYVYRPPSGE